MVVRGCTKFTTKGQKEEGYKKFGILSDFETPTPFDIKWTFPKAKDMILTIDISTCMEFALFKKEHNSQLKCLEIYCEKVQFLANILKYPKIYMRAVQVESGTFHDWKWGPPVHLHLVKTMLSKTTGVFFSSVTMERFPKDMIRLPVWLWHKIYSFPFTLIRRELKLG